MPALTQGQTGVAAVDYGDYVSVVNRNSDLATITYVGAPATQQPSTVQGRVLIGPFSGSCEVTIAATSGSVFFERVADSGQSAPVVYTPPDSGALRGASYSGIACAVGDSHVKNGFVFGSNAANMTQASGWIAWLQAFTSHSIWVPWGITNTGTELSGCVLAVSGTTTVDLINSQLSRAVALRTGWVFVSTGGNDLAAFPNDSVYTITARMKTIIETLAASGKRVVMPTLSPRAAGGTAGWSSTTLTAPQITAAILKQQAINQWLRDYARGNPSLVLVDDYWRLVDTASATGDPLATMVSDGLHLSATGSFIRAQVALAAIAGTYRPVIGLASSLADAYNATNNVTGNHAPNSTLQGTGGTAGTGMTGTVATSYTVDRDGGADTATVTAQARADGLNGREQVIAVTGTGGKVRFYPSALISTANFNNGDYAYWEVDVTVTSVGGNGQWQGLDMFSWMNGGTANTQALFLTPGGVEQVPATSWSGTLRTPINQTSTGTNSILPYPRINSVNGGNPSVTFRRPRYQKVDRSLLGIVMPGVDF